MKFWQILQFFQFWGICTFGTCASFASLLGARRVLSVGTSLLWELDRFDFRVREEFLVFPYCVIFQPLRFYVKIILVYLSNQKFPTSHSMLSTSIYDLVLIYVCHFHHHQCNGCSTLGSIEILVRLSWIPASKEFLIN